MYNLLEHSPNYSDTTGSLWFYSKDEATNFDNDIANTDNFKSFKYKTEWLENAPAQPTPNQANQIVKIAPISLPLKYLRSLKMPLIHCKTELKLRWKKHYVLSVLGNKNEQG